VDPLTVVTCSHVLDGCQRVFVRAQFGFRAEAQVIARDRTNDIALLRVKVPITKEACLRLALSAPEVGERVSTIGFPDPEATGLTLKHTEGVVNALAGQEGDPSLLQLSVPTQAGNSGGPLLDAAGDVVGVVLARPVAPRAAAGVAEVPQNVSYAVRASYVRRMLDATKLPSRSNGESERRIDRTRLIESIRSCIVLITVE